MSILNFSLIKIVLFTFIVSLLFVPLAKRIAIFLGALDMPNARKVHQKPMPRMGGIAVYISFLAGYILFGEVTTQMLSILIGSFIIFLLGLFDDIKPISAKHKFLVQIIAASVVVLYGKLYFTEISFLGISLSFNYFLSVFLSILFIVAISNAINLIDGLDGLAGGISSIYFLTIGIISIILGKYTNLDATLSFIMLGATLGFLFHNFPPAKIFMGDSGSLFIGFMISVIAVLGFKVATLTSLVIPVTILAVPILDTLLAIFRRLLKGEKIGTPDKDHIHHQLLKLKFSTRKSILIIYLITGMFSFISILYVLGDVQEVITLYVVAAIILLIVILKTNILYEHKKEKK